MSRRTYRVVETVITQRFHDIEARSKQDAITKATDGKPENGLSYQVRGVVDHEYVDVHAVTAPSPEPDAQDANWNLREAVYDGWLAQLHGVLDSFGRRRSSSTASARERWVYAAAAPRAAAKPQSRKAAS